MTSVRGVRRPPFECAARSSGPRYASTSTRRPQSAPPSNRRTRTLPSSSLATVVVSRSKIAASRTLPGGGVSSDPCFAKPLSDRVPAAFVHVQCLVRGLVHGLPVEALPPGGDPDAELHRDRQLGGAVEVVERLAHPEPDLARVALVRIRHRDAELVTPEPAARVGGPDRALELGCEHADRLVSDVVTVRVVDVLQVVEV